MPLQDSQILDLATSTLNDLGRMRFNQIAQPLQRYEVMGRILREERVGFESGIGIQRTIMFDDSGSAKMVGVYETDTVNVGDVLTTIDIPWKHTVASWAWERRELLMNRGAAQIVNLFKVRRIDAELSLARLMETQFWNKPVDSSATTPLFGVPYWVVPNTTTGFNGGNPAGFTSGAGNVTVADQARWSNYTAQYVDVTKLDLITTMRRAYRQIRFESPVDIPDFRRGKGDQYRIYVNNDTIELMEALGEDQNENLGRDLASMDDTMVFRKNPIIWIPELDTDTTDPIYMLNYAFFNPVFLRGDYLRETDPAKAPNQHNVFTVFIDLTWNVLCTDRRRQAVITL